MNIISLRVFIVLLIQHCTSIGLSKTQWLLSFAWNHIGQSPSWLVIFEVFSEQALFKHRPYIDDRDSILQTHLHSQYVCGKCAILTKQNMYILYSMALKTDI